MPDLTMQRVPGALAAVLCGFWLCCAQQPGNISSLEEDLLNTLTSTSLGWTSFPPKAWHETPMALAVDSPHRTYEACTSQNRNTTIALWSTPISSGAARLIYLDLAFAVEEEGSCEVSGGSQASEATLSIHLTETNPKWLRVQPDPELTIPIPLDRRFPRKYLCEKIEFPKIREWMISVANQPLRLVTSKQFYLGFQYRGPCLLLASVRVFYRQCRAEMAGLARYPQTPSGSDEVAGSCVENAASELIPQRLCGENGHWGVPSEKCRCFAGFAEHEGACEACKIGFFKPKPGNLSCRKCPANSHSDSEGSLHCPCFEGFFRADSNISEMHCTKPPSAPENAAFTINGTWVLLSWDLPRNWDQQQDLSFQISCVYNPRGNATAWQPCANLTYHPGQRKLTTGLVRVESLRPGMEYRFSIEAVNEVSHLQQPTEKASSVLTLWLLENQYTTMQHSRQQDQPQEGPSAVLVPVLAGCLLALVLLGAAVIWRMRREKTYSGELQVEHAVRYRRRTVKETLQLLPIPESLKRILKDLVLAQNQLTLGRRLGTGEFGSVYEGVLVQTGSPNVTVAVKTMKDGMCTSEELGAFLGEAALMKSFDHPNVLQLLGVSFNEACEQSLPMPMLVLPYMRHGDLRFFLLSTQHQEVPMTLPLRILVGFLIDIASGMDYLSSRGFIHRDLAARNCMLREDLRVCVADFGLSRKVYSKDYYRQGAASRMPVKWMALESITECIYTPKTDVWSFGVTMWEVLSCGTTPYPGVQNHEMYLHLQAGHRMERPPLCPEELYDAMCHCWQEYPGQRPTFSELLRTLQDLESTLPLSTVGGCKAGEDVSQYVNGSLFLLGACESASLEEAEARNSNKYFPSPT